MNHMAEETPQTPPVTIVAASRDASNRPMRYQHDRRRSRADFDNDVPPVPAALLADGENARQNSLQCCRRAPYCFRRGEKGSRCQ